ncbi:bis(5'-nucleosyl)-tetraphosphatase (symmetrical) YqeK [soil metagenome]
MGVEGLAVALAHFWGVDEEKVLLAALLHDYAKGESKHQLQEQLDRCGDFPASEEDRKHPELWHGLVAAEVAKSEFGIEDSEIRSAVAYHTTGIPDFGDVGICLYVADTLEPTRKYEGVEEKRREILFAPIKDAARATAALKLDLLYRKNHSVHSNTLKMLEWLTPNPTGEDTRQ